MADGISPCGHCGRDTVTGWCDSNCRAQAADGPQGALDLPAERATWRLVGRGGVTWPDRLLTEDEAATWAHRVHSAYPTLAPRLQLVE